MLPDLRYATNNHPLIFFFALAEISFSFFQNSAICLPTWMCKMIHACWEAQGRSNAKARPTLLLLLQGDCPANQSHHVEAQDWLRSAAPLGSLSKLPNSQLVKHLRRPRHRRADGIQPSSHQRGHLSSHVYNSAKSAPPCIINVFFESRRACRVWEEGSFLRKEGYQRYHPSFLLTSPFPNFFRPSVKLLTP